MIFNTIKSTITYVISLDIILGAISYWAYSFGNTISNVLAILVSSAGLVISYYTIRHIIEKIKLTRIERKLKEIEFQDKKNKQSYIIK